MGFLFLGLYPPLLLLFLRPPSSSLTSNTLTSNTLISNTLTSNTLTSNTLTSNTLTSNTLTSNILSLHFAWQARHFRLSKGSDVRPGVVWRTPGFLGLRAFVLAFCVAGSALEALQGA